MVIWTSCAAFFRLILPSMMDRTLSKSKAPGQLKASWIILRNGNAQLSQLTTNSGGCSFRSLVQLWICSDTPYGVWRAVRGLRIMGAWTAYSYIIRK